ncbi:M23 family metallopeptidase [Sphingomonas sp. UYP23]
MAALLLMAPAPAISASTPAPCTSSLIFRVQPKSPYVERLGLRSLLNFDFLAVNRGASSLDLREIDLVASDASGKPVLVKQVDHNGSLPGISTVRTDPLRQGQSATLFNPFFDLGTGIPPANLRFAFTFRSVDSSGGDVTCSINVRPRSFATTTTFALPLSGRLLAWDTHDFFSHHRRRSLTDADAISTGRTENSSRYAYDLSMVDAAGSMFSGTGTRNTDWYGWNQPVLAAGNGTVVRVESAQPDQDVGNPAYPKAAIDADPWNEFGNSVVIDHGNNVFSVLAHMRKGSIKVRPGQLVRRGMMVGRVGFSGAVLTIHTHFQLQDSPNFVAEGLPVQFSNFVRLRGSATIPVAKDAIATGEIVWAPRPTRPRAGDRMRG